MQVWRAIADALEADGLCALVTLCEVEGSSPREAGARMVVFGNGSFRGTIGGGTLEWRSLADAQAAMSKREPSVSWTRQALGPALGQCCGGSVRVLTEVLDRSRLEMAEALALQEAEGPFLSRGRIGETAVLREFAGRDCDGAAPVKRSGNMLVERFGVRRRPLYLFGAGHVGRALVLAMAPLRFEVTWIDDRAGAFPPAVPRNVKALSSVAPVGELSAAPRGAFVLAMTHSHPLDFEIVFFALQQKRFDYVGLIGSGTKRALFTSRLRQAGVSDGVISQLACPIGVPGLESKRPAEIALSVAYDLVLRDEALTKNPPNSVARQARRA